MTLGIALVTADGKVYTAGDVKTEVSIQSISNVFTMAVSSPRECSKRAPPTGVGVPARSCARSIARLP